MRRRGTTGDAGGDTAEPNLTLWPPRLAKIRVPGFGYGTGWAFGDHGVLTAFPLLAPLAASSEPTPVEIVIGASPGRSFAATMIWHDEPAGVAVLSIAEGSRLTWQTLLRSTPDVPLGYPRTEPIEAVTVIGLPARAAAGSESSTVAWMLTPPEQTSGRLTPSADRSAAGVLDVDGRDLPRSARRHGLPGGIVLGTEPEPMVLGVLHGKPRGRRSQRYDLTPLPDPTVDTAFAAALTSVGAPVAVYSQDGPTLLKHLRPDCLDACLRPKRVGDVTDLGFFGVRPARTDIAEEVEPYFGWVSRPERAKVSAALDHAIAGEGARFVILKGPSAAGKSRTLAEAMRSHSALRDYAVLVPRRSRSLLDMPARLVPRRSVVVLDNLSDHPATALTRGRLRRFLDEHPETVFVATLLDLPEASGSARLVDNGAARKSQDDGGAGSPLGADSLSGVLAVAHDDELTRTITVGPDAVWARAGGSTNRSDWALARAKKQGLGLGEYLAGYHELADHYAAALWPTRALVDLVADWERSGIGETLPLDTARALWDDIVPTELPRDELRAFERLTPIEREKRWRGALAYACDEVLGCASLLVQDDGGLRASEFTRVHVDSGAISTRLWDHLMRAHRASPRQRVALGIAALGSGTPQRALRAFESALYQPDDADDAPWHVRLREILARRGVAMYHSRMGRDEQAVMVFTDLVDTYGADEDVDVCEQVAQALLGIGLTFAKLGSHGQAASAYTELVNRYGDHPSPVLSIYVARAMLGQAVTLDALDRRDEARTAYADIAARFDEAPSAATQEIVAIARAALAAS